MHIALSIALLLAAADVYAADQITFNGVPLGLSERMFRNTHSGYRCSAAHWTNLMCDRVCVAGSKSGPAPAAAAFAGMPANIHASFFEDRLALVTVYVVADFDDVTSALFEGYGKPDALQRFVDNQGAAAAVPKYAIAVWKREGVTLQAVRLSKDQTELTYRADWLTGEFAKRRALQQQRWAWLTEHNQVTGRRDTKESSE